jgi:hypothetical protein
MVETEDRVVGKMFARVAFQFQTKLMEVSQVISTVYLRPDGNC